jgi:hypothetical protein
MLKFMGKSFLVLLIVSIVGGFYWLKIAHKKHQGITSSHAITKDLVAVPSNHNQTVNLTIRIHNRQLEYREGEHLSFTVTANKSGYITLWDVGTSGRVTRIFPNQFSANSMYVEAGKTASIGGESTRFDFKVTGQAGFEDVYAIWTAKAGDQPDKDHFESSFSFAKDLLPFSHSNRKSWASDKVSFEIITDHESDTIVSTATGKQFKIAGKVYIVAMGANVQNLTKTNLDARNFAQQMQAMFPQDRVNLQIIENVTKKQFLSALKRLGREVTANDLVFIYFSGHGLLQADHNNGDEAFDAYFVTSDKHEVDANGDFILTQAVSDDEFAYYVNQIRSDNIISVIDACHSGGMQKGMLKGRVKYFNGRLKGAFVAPDRLIIPQSNQPIPVIDKVKGLVFAAAEESDSAIEVRQGGVFTQILLQQIQNAKVNDNLMDIFMSTRRIVKRETRREQIPVYIGDSGVAEALGLVSVGGVYSYLE